MNVGDTAEVIRDYWSESGFTFPAMMQEKGEVSASFGVRAYPTNYLIGPDGKVIWRGVGFEEEVVRELLGLDS
jgi:cytochrome c biogenesis protein CcmG/thiol:disulfide interchange protein DsbE